MATAMKQAAVSLSLCVCLAVVLVPSSTQGQDRTTVSQVQQALDSLGYQPGPTDGVFGPTSEQALRQFQLDRELPVTGAIDEVTLGALLGDAQSPSDVFQALLADLVRLTTNGAHDDQVLTRIQDESRLLPILDLDRLEQSGLEERFMAAVTQRFAGDLDSLRSLRELYLPMRAGMEWNYTLQATGEVWNPFLHDTVSDSEVERRAASGDASYKTSDTVPSPNSSEASRWRMIVDNAVLEPSPWEATDDLAAAILGAFSDQLGATSHEWRVIEDSNPTSDTGNADGNLVRVVHVVEYRDRARPGQRQTTTYRDPLISFPMLKGVERVEEGSSSRSAVTYEYAPPVVTVPAGAFRNCIEVTRFITSLEDGRVWTERRIFAPRVGLVSLDQVNPEGGISLSMKLQSFVETP